MSTKIQRPVNSFHPVRPGGVAINPNKPGGHKPHRPPFQATDCFEPVKPNRNPPIRFPPEGNSTTPVR